MIAIIFSTCNCLEYTKKAVASIRTKHPFKVIVVDDGSTDGTVEWAEAQGFMVIRCRPPTVSDAWNPGCVGKNYNLAMSKAIDIGCSHMIFAHNDIIMHKDAIDNLVHLYEQKRNEGYVLFTGIQVNPLVKVNPREYPKIDDIDEIPTQDYMETPFLRFFIMTEETLRKVGPFDEEFTDGTDQLDGDYKHRMNLLGVKFAGTRLAWYYHFTGTTSAMNKLNMRIIGDGWNSKRYMEKWGGFWLEEKYKTPFDK